MTQRQCLNVILDGEQGYSFSFSKVVVFKGNTQIAFFDKDNTTGGNAKTVLFKDSRYWGSSIKLGYLCLKDIQEKGALLDVDESDYITIDSNERWVRIVDYPHLVIMKYIGDGKIDSISLIADDEMMLTFQIKYGEYDILSVDPIDIYTR